MSVKETIGMVGIGAISGVAGLLVMDPVTTIIQDMTPKDAQEQEEAANNGSSAMTNAVEKTAGAVGVRLDDEQTETGANIFHYAIGIFGGILYTVLRRYINIPAPLLGALTGLGMFVVLDEGMNTLLGFSAPPSAYPKETHLRGLVGHLSFGVSVAVVAETLRFLMRKVRGCYELGKADRMEG